MSSSHDTLIEIVEYKHDMVMQRKLIKTITEKAFDLDDPMPIWRLFDDIASQGTNDVSACAACAMSAITANKMSSMLKGRWFVMWNEQD